MRNCAIVQIEHRGLRSSRESIKPALLFGLLLAAAGIAAAHAQDLPDVAQGLQPYAAYHGGGLDQVSMMNGGPVSYTHLQTLCQWPT